MPALPRVISLSASRTLGAVRLTTGTLGLFAPQILVQRFGKSTQNEVAAAYAFRLFGVRTIILGVELLLMKGQAREQAVKLAPIIHGSDTLAALIAARQGNLPKAAGLSLVGISAINTALALLSRSAGKTPPGK